MARRAAIASALADAGWRAATPAAIVRDASRPTQQVWRGSLAEMAAGAAIVEGDGAATIVIGEVAALRLAGTSTMARRNAVGRTARSAKRVVNTRKRA
jgi:siroheme synthase